MRGLKHKPEKTQMTAVTKITRASVIKIVEQSREYDASTVRISSDGRVSALKDADKTYAGNDPIRYLVGCVSEMVAPDGSIREGWVMWLGNLPYPRG